MSNWVNFAEIRAQVSLEDVIVRFYGITNLKAEGDKLIGPCPVHGGDSARAFHADLSKNVWHCFSKCKGGGNQLDFVAKKERIPIREAALKLQVAFLTGEGPPRPTAPASSAPTPATTPPPRPQRPERTPDPGNEHDGNPPLDLALNLLPDHPHLMDVRGLALGTVNHFGVGYCPRGILRGMIAIPIHDHDGQLVAYAGRRLKPEDIRNEGKYKFPKGFRKDFVLFNYHRAKGHMTGPGTKGLILVEGFFTVLKLFEMGFVNVVASMGSSVSDRQVELLATAPEVVILYDGDEAGRVGAEAARAKLNGRTIVRSIRLPSGEPEDLEPRALRWLMNGAHALDLIDVAFRVRSDAAPLVENGENDPP